MIYKSENYYYLCNYIQWDNKLEWYYIYHSNEFVNQPKV